MQNVTDFWKAIHRQHLVNETYVEISFDIADPDALADAAAEDNGAVYISNTAQTVSGIDKNMIPYATLEQNLWLLDGSREFIPDSDYGDTGYIGNIMSGPDGSFSLIPVVDIRFSEVHEPVIPGITITWGPAYGEYAEIFKITAYNGAAVVAEKRVEDNKSVQSVVEFDIENYDLIRIEIIKWCLPNRRPRIAEIFVGVNRIYGKSDITGYEHEQDISPISASAPMNRMSFSIDNSGNIYDPNNETGLSKYLMERQEMSVRYGMKISDGNIEYIPAGRFYLSEWDAPQNGLEATFTARDLLEFLRKTYTKGLYNAAGVSLYDLAVAVLTEANLPLHPSGSVMWIIDESLKSLRTVAPLPLVSLAECLQYIAQAAGCVIYTDRSGILHIEPISTDTSDYELTGFNMFSRPEVSLQKPLKAVSTKIYNYFADENTRELFSGTIPISGTEEVVITYSDTAVNVVATVTNGTLSSAVYYSNACYLTITGASDVTISVSGKVLNSSNMDYITEAGNTGEIQTVENPLITSAALAAVNGAWVKSWLMNRKIMTMDGWRADPRLDATDIILSENKFGVDSVRMTSVKYTYAGAFKGSGEGRVI
jgi:hypothetical protein